ncbi:rhamnosyl transferase, partial [Vibrio parahaemolyticus]
MKLVFVTVNYNNIDETRKVLNCFSGLSHGENSVLYVVDNSDSKSECQSLDKENTNNKIKFLYPKENL